MHACMYMYMVRMKAGPSQPWRGWGPSAARPPTHLNTSSSDSAKVVMLRGTLSLLLRVAGSCKVAEFVMGQMGGGGCAWGHMTSHVAGPVQRVDALQGALCGFLEGQVLLQGGLGRA